MQNDTDEYHDNESTVDVFDLFNACNGITRDGFLDVGELEKYSPEDAEALNVDRLRKIWEHTISGCFQCREIISALHRVRGAVRDITETKDPANGPNQDLDHIKTTS